MDFGQVDAAFGKKDGKWAVKVSMKGVVDSPNDVKYTEDGKPTQQVYITDGPGRRERVKILGNFPDLTQIDLKQNLIFEIWSTRYENKKYYKGFCNVPDDREGPSTEPTPNTRYDYKPHNAQPTPQTAQRAPQAATQPAKAPDWDAKDERIVRQNTLNRAVELYIATGRSPWPFDKGDMLQITTLAEKFRDYVYEGNVSPGDQFAKEQGLPTAAEDAAEERADGQATVPY